jgi:hypothetical protein
MVKAQAGILEGDTAGQAEAKLASSVAAETAMLASPI